MADKSLEEEIKEKAQQARKLAKYLSSTEDLVENQILRAQQEGKFDNLPGAGQPIDLEENPFEPSEMRMAFKILKENDFAPRWIEIGKEVDNDLQRFWAEVDYFRRYTLMMNDQSPDSPARRRFQRKKENFYYECQLSLERISKKILDYNLHSPTYWVGRPNLIIEKEMAQVTATIEAAMKP